MSMVFSMGSPGDRIKESFLEYHLFESCRSTVSIQCEWCAFLPVSSPSREVKYPGLLGQDSQQLCCNCLRNHYGCWICTLGPLPNPLLTLRQNSAILSEHNSLFFHTKHIIEPIGLIVMSRHHIPIRFLSRGSYKWQNEVLRFIASSTRYRLLFVPMSDSVIQPLTIACLCEALVDVLLAKRLWSQCNSTLAVKSLAWFPYLIPVQMCKYSSWGSYLIVRTR